LDPRANIRNLSEKLWSSRASDLVVGIVGDALDPPVVRLKAALVTQLTQLGSGQYFRRFCATGSIRFCGITLLGKGCRKQFGCAAGQAALAPTVQGIVNDDDWPTPPDAPFVIP